MVECRDGFDMLHKFIVVVRWSFIQISVRHFKHATHEGFQSDLIPRQMLGFKLLSQHPSIVGSTMHQASKHLKVNQRRYHMPVLPYSGPSPLGDIDSVHAGSVPRAHEIPHDSPFL